MFPERNLIVHNIGHKSTKALPYVRGNSLKSHLALGDQSKSQSHLHQSCVYFVTPEALVFGGCYSSDSLRIIVTRIKKIASLSRKSLSRALDYKFGLGIKLSAEISLFEKKLTSKLLGVFLLLERSRVFVLINKSLYIQYVLLKHESKVNVNAVKGGIYYMYNRFRLNEH